MMQSALVSLLVVGGFSSFLGKNLRERESTKEIRSVAGKAWLCSLFQFDKDLCVSFFCSVEKMAGEYIENLFHVDRIWLYIGVSVFLHVYICMLSGYSTKS